MSKLSKVISCILAAAVIVSSAVSSAAALTSVSAPNIKLSNTKSGVKITWKKPKGVKRYVLLRKVQKAKKFKVLKNLSSTKKAYTDKKTAAGKKYTYALKSVNGGASATSASKSIVRLKAPAKLRFVKAKSGSGDNGLQWEEPGYLKWNKVKGAKSYRIYRCEYDGKKWGAYKKYTTTYDTEDYYSIRSGKYTKFRVTAVNGKSESAPSKPTKKRMELSGSEVTVKREDSGVNIKWDKIGGVDKYELYRSEDEGAFKLLKTLDSKTVKYLDKDVEKGVYYSYYVIGVKDKMKSEKGDGYIDALYYDDCDYAVELGEHNDLFSSVYTLMNNLTNSYNSLEFESSDTNILKVNITKADDGSEIIKLVGVNTGYATLTVKSTMDFGDGDAETITDKYKIRVQDTPVYLTKLKSGSQGSMKRLAVPVDVRGLISLSENALLLTSSDTTVVDVKTKDNVPYLVGVKPGEATVTVKLDTQNKTLGEFKLLGDFNAEFKVLVE